MSSPQVALGAARTNTPLSPTGDLLSTDGLYQTILQGAQGGSSTANYFAQVNAVAQIYKNLGTQGPDAWTKGSDEQGNPVYFASETDASGKVSYASITLQGLQVDNDNIKQNGTTWTINGVKYSGVATAVKTIGYSNFKFVSTSWDIGVAAAGSIPINVFLPLIQNCLGSVAIAVGNAIRSALGGAAAGGEALQQSEIELQNLGEKQIAEVGVAVADTAADGAAIASGVAFIGVAVAIAVVFIALSFTLHNSYHSLRLWNLTKYNLDWTYYFDTEFGSNEGQFSSAPLDQTNNTPVTISGATCATGIPGVTGPPNVQYADFNIASSHQFNGIGWAIQLTLKDPTTNAVVYTTTVYYDVPFSGDNSTNLTFDAVTDLGSWYANNQGNNKSTKATQTSGDQAITVTSTYDYLDGQHGVPSQVAGSSNEAYYYQSMLVIAENGLKVSDLTS